MINAWWAGIRSFSAIKVTEGSCQYGIVQGCWLSDAVVFRYDGGRRLATLLASIASPVFSLV
jgi:hypothetical protein